MASQPIRAGFQTVIPYLSVKGATSLVGYLESVFGAKRTFTAESGKHFEVQIGDCKVMIGEVGDGSAKTGQLFMYVPDTEAGCRTACGAN